jgi:hypothetical protein
MEGMGHFFHIRPSPTRAAALFTNDPKTGEPPNIHSMKTSILLALSLALALPLHAGNKNAGAQNPQKPQPEKVFKKTDKDGDGFVSKEEFLAKAENVFRRKDKDHDGKLTPTELAGKKPHAANKAKAGKRANAGKNAKTNNKANGTQKAKARKQDQATPDTN